MSDVYSPDEVEEILRRALANQKDGLRRDELVQAATEAGIGREAVESAIDELDADRGTHRLRQRVKERRRRRFGQRLISLAIVNVFLAGVDYLTGAGWWVQWPLLASGFLLAWDARSAFVPGDDDIDKAARRMLRREERQRRKRVERGARRGRSEAQKQFEIAVDRGLTALLGAISKHIDPSRPTERSTSHRDTDRSI